MVFGRVNKAWGYIPSLQTSDDKLKIECYKEIYWKFWAIRAWPVMSKFPGFYFVEYSDVGDDLGIYFFTI